EFHLVTGAPSRGTAVLEERQQTQPTNSALGRNYPNPFNAETIIPFELTEAADVTLTVFNLSGQGVADLVQGFRLAGTYHARWDGRGEDGHHLASGTYLLRLQTGTLTQTRKLLLLR
ncbi:MAG: T9SS type A sorting domain-containing protein, partial [Candidatus Latescibacteria bacterium]|nr:T9SS type A sorting domain-containing protein [Candidatus Latescibacterota bacterium]